MRTKGVASASAVGLSIDLPLLSIAKARGRCKSLTTFGARLNHSMIRIRYTKVMPEPRSSQHALWEFCAFQLTSLAETEDLLQSLDIQSLKGIVLALCNDLGLRESQELFLLLCIVGNVVPILDANQVFKRLLL